MPIKIAFRRRYINGLVKRHAQHKQVILRILHKIRSHPAFLKPGAQPSKAAMPKSIPKQPSNLNAKGAGFWSHVKKGWSWVKKQFHAHKGKVIDAAKKHGTAAAKHIGGRLYDAGKKAGKQAMDRAIQVAERNVEHYTSKAEKRLQGMADKAEFHISQYDKPPKKGSGMGQVIGRGGRGPYANLLARSFQGRLAPGALRVNFGGRGKTMSQLIGVQKRRGPRR